MFRTVILIAVMIFCVMASSCAPYRVIITNDTGFDVNIRVELRNSQDAHGILKDGASLNLERNVELVEGISYNYLTHSCHLNHENIREDIFVEGGNVYSIIIKPCA